MYLAVFLDFFRLMLIQHGVHEEKVQRTSLRESGRKGLGAWLIFVSRRGNYVTDFSASIYCPIDGAQL